MANPTGAFGLRPVRHIDGSPWNGATKRVYISDHYATALFIGDPVVWVSGAILSTEKDASAKFWTMNTHAGTDGLVINGVIVSFEPDPNNLSLKYRPASTERWANICVATPDIIYQVRDDGSGTPAPVFVCQNAELVAGSGGSTVTGLSSFVLDATTPAAAQTYPLLIMGLSNFEGNELDDYAVWDVLLNTCYNTTGLYLGITCT